MVQGTSRGVGGAVQGRSELERGSSREWERGVQGGSANEFLAQRPFEFLVK